MLRLEKCKLLNNITNLKTKKINILTISRLVSQQQKKFLQLKEVLFANYFTDFIQLMISFDLVKTSETLFC